MKTFETSATVESHGNVRIAGVPFAPGTEVEVTISPMRRSAEEFTATWERVCSKLRNSEAVQALNDDDIHHEIDNYRKGQ